MLKTLKLSASRILQVENPHLTSCGLVQAKHTCGRGSVRQSGEDAAWMPAFQMEVPSLSGSSASDPASWKCTPRGQQVPAPTLESLPTWETLSSGLGLGLV